jgi:hypothetical protein
LEEDGLIKLLRKDVDNINMNICKIIIALYFLWGLLYNLFDMSVYLYKRYTKNIRFVITAEEGYIHIRARIFRSLAIMLINVALLIITIKI